MTVLERWSQLAATACRGSGLVDGMASDDLAVQTWCDALVVAGYGDRTQGIPDLIKASAALCGRFEEWSELLGDRRLTISPDEIWAMLRAERTAH